jgi:hypothetical protein
VLSVAATPPDFMMPLRMANPDRLIFWNRMKKRHAEIPHAVFDAELFGLT